MNEPDTPLAPSPPVRHNVGPGLLARYALALFLGLVGLAAAMRFVTGDSGLVRVRPHHVAVVLDLVDGSLRTVTQPGWCFFTPGLEKVFLLDRAPSELVMQGDGGSDLRHAPRLTVRAHDGSAYGLDALRVGFQLAPSRAAAAVFESGPGNAGSAVRFDWLRHAARSALLDEFGRVSAEEATNPARLENARVGARDRLRAELESHGLELMEVGSPKPIFDRPYEKAIGDRVLAEGEAARLESELSLLRLHGVQLLAQHARDTEDSLAELTALLDRELLEAERTAETSLAQAETKGRGLRAESRSLVAGGALEAEGLAITLAAELDGLAGELTALERFGATAVREAWTARMTEFSVRIEPASHEESKP